MRLKGSAEVLEARRQRAIQMLADELSLNEIARRIGYTGVQVSRIRRRFAEGGLDGLQDRPRSGRPSRVTPAYRRELREALKRGPPAYGYLFTVWSLPRLNTHLKAKTGLAFCAESVRRFVRTEGYVFRRPKHTLKGRRDEKAFRQAQRQLRRLKKGLCVPAPTTNSGSRTRPSSTSIPI